jgi:NhaA family Na+:H+ antiporter
MKSKAELNVFQRFFRTEALSGFILLAAAVVALIWANSPWANSYNHIWETLVSIGAGDRVFRLSLHGWINDGLMAVFFLLVGVEIKRELVGGELSSPKKAALPIAGAIGGMIMPALLYSIANIGGPGTSGWGIPMATDIAFALGALTIIAPNAPNSAKIFLTALAIVDDMGAVLVIALFYSDKIVMGMLGAAGLTLLVLVTFNLLRVTRLWPYLIVGVVLWYFVHESGVHATIAAVALAMTIPTRTRINSAEFSARARRILDRFDEKETGEHAVIASKGQQNALSALDHARAAVAAPVVTLERSLHRFSAFVVMPVFALANAGVQLGGPLYNREIAIGVLAGLLVGKPVGIVAASWLAVKLGLARLQKELSWRLLHGVAWLGGIGFTMSLFIGMLAFDDPLSIATAKKAIFCGSLVAGLIAAAVLHAVTRSTRERSPEPRPVS